MMRRVLPIFAALLLFGAACDSGGGTTEAGADVVECAPQCDGKVCGPDGCGGYCGECQGCYGIDNTLCQDDGLACISPECCPLCEPGWECGPDGCGGVCGGSCPEGETCDPVTRTCSCTPDCSDPCAIDDGCGNRCDACPDGEGCSLTGECRGELLDCIEYDACVDGCEDSEAVCVHENCDAYVAPEAFSHHGLFLDCIYRNLDACEDAISVDACLMEACSAEYYDCYSRDESCAEVLDCLAGCGDSDCEAACNLEGTAEAQTTMDALRTCVNQACIPDNPYPGESCWDAAVAAGGDCADEYAACAAD